MAEKLVSKGQYAALRGRSPSAVSAWIKAGQLTAPALQGRKINVEEADRQLAERLDPLLSAARARRSAVASSNTGSAFRSLSEAERSQNEYLAARAASARLRLERERRELAAERGRYVLVTKIREEFGRGIAEHLQSVATSLPALAEHLGVGPQGLLVLRKWWRSRCEHTANVNRLEARDYPDFAEDPGERD